MTGNKSSRRKESSPVWRRIYLLGKIEGVKADLMREVSALAPECGAKEIDALLASRFAPAPAPKTKKDKS